MKEVGLFGILRHNKGDSYDNDYLVIDKYYKPLRYVYRASAEYMAGELTKAHSGRCKFTVVRLD